MCLQSLLPQNHPLKNLLEVDHLQLVQFAESFGQGLLTGLPWTGYANVGPFGQFGQSFKEFSGGVDEGVQVGLVLEEEDSTCILTCELELSVEEFVVFEFDGVGYAPGTPFPHEFEVIESDSEQLLFVALDSFG